MYKRMTIFALPEGTDPDEFFKYHTEIHAEDVKKAAGPGLLKKLKKYTISRVVENIQGEPNFFGVIQMWWDSKEDAAEYYRVAKNYKTASGKSPPDDFWSRAILRCAVALEEKEIKF